jgi:hypothetical protein
MRIPRFWAKTSGAATAPDGRRYRLEPWGWSDASVADALATARRRLAEISARVARGEIGRQYPYGERPLREEIVRAMGEPRVGLLGRLLGRRQPEPDPALARIRESCRSHGRNSFRIYRTKAGYRALATDLELDPTSARAREILSSFGADPRFIHLCGVQHGFRARLTPKPWRAGCPLPPGQYPREAETSRQRFAAWLEGYDAACARYATRARHTRSR